MAKLVVLNEGLAGQSHDLKVEKTTVGRVADNTFPLNQASVSSHHCEVILRGSDVVIKDLNSTNGTFINGQQLANAEAVLKPGQVLRLGQVELRLETGAGDPASPAAPVSAPAPAAPAPKKPAASTMVINKGVSLQQLEQGPQGGFDTTKGGFTKKSNKTNKLFLIGGIVAVLIIVALFLVVLGMLKK
jgi:pSer/pThr/pTyr-binding forkhead associated (FHA) protein